MIACLSDKAMEHEEPLDPQPPEWQHLVRITSLRERLWDFGILWALHSRAFTPRVFSLDQHRVFKWIATPTEALTMKYIAENTSVPLPRVLDVLKYKGRYVLIMEYIAASEREWSKLSALEMASVAEQLAGFISQLRKLVPPRPGRVECVDGTACRDPKLNIALEPCTVDGFHEMLGHDFIRTSADDSGFAALRPAFERIHGRAYRTMFCHADLTWHNILIRDGKIVSVLDWQSGGWYPEYWEYTRLSYIWRSMDVTFWNLIQPHLAPYEDELQADKALSAAFSY